MDNWSYFRRPLKLHEIIEELEKDDIHAPVSSITIFPPDNANGAITDEDSGDEQEVNVDNLPGSQLRVTAEINLEVLGDNDESRMSDFDDSSDPEDNLPLSKLIPLKRLKKFNWTLGHDLPESEMSWNNPHSVKNNSNPYELFTLYFDENLMDQLRYYTNTYASQKNRTADISATEMKCFIGVLILSGYHRLARKNMYWENSSDTKNELVRSAISRDRFKHIMQNIHCCDNTKLKIDDKFSKVRPIIDILNKKFIEHAPMEEAHSIDESMVPYYGRHGSKQFIRGKPIRWGYKFWTGTTRGGYIEWFEPYQGSSNIISPKYKNLGLGSSIVLEFCDVLQKQFPNIVFHLYFDNFFTSLSLLHELNHRNLRGTGTIRENRISENILSSSSAQKKQKRGTYEYMLEKEKQIIICRWNDNNLVTMASNYCAVKPTSLVRRFSQKEKKHILVEQPNIVKKYNENMGGVDRADQNISLYRTSIRGKKWYFPIFCHLIDMAVQNAWQLHRGNGGRMDQLSFKRSLAQGLLETNKRPCTYQCGKSRRDSHDSSRYDRLDHLIVYHETQIRCRLCSKKVNFRCKKCDVGLHPKECFYNYHVQR